MNPKIISIVMFLSIMIASCSNAQQDDFPVLKGPYLGQNLPGNRPEVFAPGIISVEANFEHSAAVFSPDGSEVFWCTNVDWYTDRKRQGGLRLYSMKIVDGKWTAPQPAPFAKDLRVERPVFSPDGNRLYFECCSDPNDIDNIDIFVVERIGDRWSEPKPVSPLINTRAWERLHCVTADGSIYFTRNLMSNNEQIFISRFENGSFVPPEKLGESYNTDEVEFVILLGPNEEYMLIDQSDSQHSSHVYISFKNTDGTWGERIKTPYYAGGFLALSPDGKYLFMMGEAIYWVSTSFLKTLKP